eukprot:10436705-Alexandrium_andersonii.AAC.1
MAAEDGSEGPRPAEYPGAQEAAGGQLQEHEADTPRQAQGWQGIPPPYSIEEWPGFAKEFLTDRVVVHADGA